MNRTTGPWMRSARFDGGLLVPARPRRFAFDLVLAPDHALVRGGAERLGSLVLPWSLHRDTWASRPAESGWSITAWAGKGGDLGAAVNVNGAFEEEATAALPYLKSLAVRLNAGAPGHGRNVPLHRNSGFGTHLADITAIDALCTALARREDIRPRLGDRHVVENLVQRLVTTRHDGVGRIDGARRQTVETISALRALGYEHRNGGRPLPDEIVPTAGELLPRVLDRIRQSPYSKKVPLDETAVRRIVDKTYSSVPPWPFEPLFC